MKYFYLIALIVAFVILAFVGGCQSQTAAQAIPSGVFQDIQYRTWTDTKGQTTKGALAEVDGSTVKLHMTDGRIGHVAMDRLSQQDRQYVEAHVDNPPDDSQLFYTVVFTSTQQGTPQEQELLSWFSNHPQLSTLRAGTHFKHYWRDHQMYKARVSQWHNGVFPAVWIVAPPKSPGAPAPVLYQAAGSNLPSNPNELANQIAYNIRQQSDLWQWAAHFFSEPLIGQCTPWNPFCPDQPEETPDTTPDGKIPNQPFFRVEPQIYPTLHIQDAMPIAVVLLLAAGGYWYYTKDST